jgi:hypothetical protein
MLPTGWNRPCFTGVHEDKFTESLLSRYGGRDYITVSEFLTDPQQALSRIPKTPGIYIVTTMHPAEPDAFLEVGTGGFFKGQNPNVSVQELRQKWVDGASILYIGRAGGAEIKGRKYKSTLYTRINQLLKFGRGENIGHRGGRYLWQCEDSEDFQIHWYATSEDENPVTLERQLIEAFRENYGNLPFANLR